MAKLELIGRWHGVVTSARLGAIMPSLPANGLPPPPPPGLSPDEIARRGERIYEERLRAQLEPGDNGKFIVIDVETGLYEVDADHLAASDRAAAKRPPGGGAAPFYAARIGSRTLGRIGGRGMMGR